jgi:multicomponent Na+:H+ antiporter subunit G
MDLIGGIMLALGSSFILLAAVGVVRFDDIYARMHTAAKGPALGVLLTGAGAMLTIRSVAATVAIISVIVLQIIAGSVGSHMLGRSVYRKLHPRLDGPDELADRERATDG